MTVGFIGSLSPHKGAHVLLEALSQLPPHILFNTVTYGDTASNPKYSANLRSLADASARDVEFRGAFDERNIAEVLAGLDALVVPSLWVENRPLTLLAALEARVPVIVSDMPGLTCEVKDGINGLVVSAGDSRKLARSLVRLTESPALRKSLSDSPVRPMPFKSYIEIIENEYRSLTNPTIADQESSDAMMTAPR
jgi:glycosyltransferase involved in cell wall biosynthesis